MSGPNSSGGRAGTLYLVPTPLGNLEDITFRALRVLREVKLVLAEDTRTSGALLRHFEIFTPLLSYTEQKHAVRVGRVLEILGSDDVALVSDAGMPGINDPGQTLVEAVVAAGFTVVGLAGPSSIPLAVAMAGFPVTTFTFLGFLPRSSGARRSVLATNMPSGHALVAFESPHRLRASLGDIAFVMHDRRIAVCRELTKLFEEVFRGTASEALAHFVQPRGEVVLVVEAGNAAEHSRQAMAQTNGVREFLQSCAAEGMPSKEAAARAVARFGGSRRQHYATYEQLKGQRP